MLVSFRPMAVFCFFDSAITPLVPVLDARIGSGLPLHVGGGIQTAGTDWDDVVNNESGTRAPLFLRRRARVQLAELISRRGTPRRCIDRARNDQQD